MAKTEPVAATGAVKTSAVGTPTTQVAQAGTASAAGAKPGEAAKKPPVATKRFTDDQIKEIRDLRAQVDPETKKPTWSHAKLAAKFNTGAGTISQIVRNRTYTDEKYVAVNDGK